jgi:hypothetical protein
MSASDLIDVCERIEADHADLRSLLGGLCVAAACLVGDARSEPEEAAVEALWLAATTLVERFHRHLEMEERDFLPILRGLDGWGDARAVRVH